MSITRRTFVGGSLAAGAAALLPSAGCSQQTSSGPNGGAARDKSAAESADFCFVHLTDMHVTPKRWGDKGYAACIQSVRDLKVRPAFALIGGDMAFDGNYTPKDEFEEQIRLYKEVMKGIGIPYHHCMGNHDALGWSNRRKVAPNDPDIGKKMIMDRLEWEKPYYSFDYAGWHFAILDSIYPIPGKDGPSYEPRIGKEQLEWLAHDLGRAGDRPKICMTHIAAFCNIGQWNGDPNAKSLGGMCVLDTKELRQVLERHNVAALLQGHSHKIEEYKLNDVWYLTSAAASGAWWSGRWVGSPCGYTVFRCRGTQFGWEHRTFSWDEHLEPEDDLERKKNAELVQFEREQAEMLARERAT